MSAMPTGLSREDLLSALPRAMVAGFVKTDKEFQVKEQTSGTTVTFVIIDGWTVTIAFVGDSRCILESPGGLVSLLTADHRLEANLEERERIMASGGEIGRLNTVGGAEIFDGHNGSATNLYSKENLLKDIMSSMPTSLSREDWFSVLPRAMVAGFVKTDKEFQVKEQTSGTTVTFVIMDGWTVTVASVGDSRCILESPRGLVSLLTADHRLGANLEERERIMASGGEIGRLNTVGGAKAGLRIYGADSIRIVRLCFLSN